MADIYFDDLIPQATGPRPAAPPPGGDGLTFDDLVPGADGPAAAPDGALHIRVGRPRAEAPTQSEAALRGAAQGATLGFADEGTGVANASTFDDTAPSWLKDSLLRYSPIIAAGRLAEGAQNLIMDSPGARDRYAKTVEDERAANEDARAAYPGTYLGGELGGGIASAAVAPVLSPVRVAQGAGILARGAAAAGNLAATGAAYGGATGAGEGEGGIGSRLSSVGQGALTGAVAGPVVGGALHGAGAVGGFLADNARAFTSPSVLADRVLARNLQRDAVDLPAAADRISAANTVQRPPQLLRPDGSTADLPSSHYVIGDTVHAVAPDGSPGAPLGRYQPATTEIGGQGLTLADVAGANTQGVAGNVARLPGEGRQPARQFLDDRQFGSDTVPSQGERISDQLGRTLSDRSAIETGEGILARRQADASRMYEAAYKRPLNYDRPEGQELLSLIDRIPNSAKREANEILKVSDRQGHDFTWDPTPDVNGNYRLNPVPNVRNFDYVKQALDTLIERERNPITGKLTTYGGAVQGLKAEILAKLDTLNPAYKAARQTFAGHAELYDALRAGADAFKPGTSAEEVSRAVAGMTKGEAEMYRLGAANALRDRLGNLADGVEKARYAYGTPSIRNKITALAPDEGSRKSFGDFLRNERDMFATRQKATGGSPTAERLTDETDAEHLMMGAGRVALAASHGNIREAMKATFEHMRQVNPELRGRVMNEVRKVLFNPDPAAVRALQARIEAAELKGGTRQRIVATINKALPRELAMQTTEPR